MSDSFLSDLRALIDVDASVGTRARYSSDAGLTRIVPLAVAFPRTPEQALAAFDLARAHGVPLTARGGGTPCASRPPLTVSALFASICCLLLVVGEVFHELTSFE